VFIWPKSFEDQPRFADARRAEHAGYAARWRDERAQLLPKLW
jgi:hypothetical protein